MDDLEKQNQGLRRLVRDQNAIIERLKNETDLGAHGPLNKTAHYVLKWVASHEIGVTVSPKENKRVMLDDLADFGLVISSVVNGQSGFFSITDAGKVFLLDYRGF